MTKLAAFALLTALLISPTYSFAQEDMSEDDQAAYEQLENMNWRSSETMSLPQSHAQFVIPDTYMALIGADAHKFLELTSKTTPSNNIEAVVASKDFQHEIHLEYHGEGYVDASDWDKLNPGNLLKEIPAEFHAVKWLQEPKYDPAQHTIHWALQAHQNDADTVYSVAIKLGRHGFEKLTLVSPLENYQGTGGPLVDTLGALRFAKGSTYEEYVAADKPAPHGIAAVLKEAVGAK